MKKFLLFFVSCLCVAGTARAQVYSPIPATGYNTDAVAENTTAAANTSSAIDGSNYILYSNAYGQLYSPSATGLPNNGLISAGTRTYQLEPYTQNNLLYIPALQMDSLTLSSPASYPTISLLAFATEGAGLMNIKMRFTDGTTQTFSNISLPDWFNNTPSNTVTVGFDRANRTTGTPAYAVNNPRMFYIDLNLSCANRLKSIQRVVIQNPTTNPRLCIMAVSAGIAASYSVTSNPVTCAGGNNGSATLSINGGVPPFTYSWSTTPVQTNSVANLLPVGVVNYTVADASTCAYTGNATISQSLAPTPPLTITASADPVCAGTTLTLSTTGAVSYTWSNNGTLPSTTIAPNATGIYSVAATTSANCTFTGSLTVNVNPLPALSFTSIAANLCLNSSGAPLNATPAGGTYSGPGLSFGNFYPSLAGAGTHTVSYSYTDANGCSSTTVVTTVVSSPTTTIAFTITPANVCLSNPTIALNATPAGGTYTGSGVSGSIFSPSVAGIGTKTVSYTYTDANNCTVKKTSSINVFLCTGLSAQAAPASCRVYPNPGNGSFYIKTDADLVFTIVNELGQAVQSGELNAGNDHEVFIENLLPGIYFLATPTEGVKQKIIITRQ